MGEAKEHLASLSGELEALEAKAGLSGKVTKAFEGPLIPYGAMGDDDPAWDVQQNNQLYSDDQHDYARDAIRDAYFGVQDVEVRKQLIKMRRRVEDAGRRFDREFLSEHEKELADAIRASNDLPWFMVAVLAAMCVVAGYKLGDMVGAIAGALLGFFIGQGTIDRARKLGAANVEQAKALVEQVKRDDQLAKLHTEYFSLSEELRGERDNSLDQKSAFGERIQHYRSASRS